MKGPKRPCGCYIERIGHMPARIAFCQMHEAAKDMRTALSALFDTAVVLDNEHHAGIRSDPLLWADLNTGVSLARAALAKAKEGL